MFILNLGMQFKRLNSGNRRTATLSITNTVANLQNNDSTPIDVTTPTEIRGFELYNANNYPVWFKIFASTSSGITLSSATPAERYELAPGTVTLRSPGHPITIHSPQISFAVTREFAAGATSPGTAVTGHIIYGTN